jgi:hypothetical protein
MNGEQRIQELSQTSLEQSLSGQFSPVWILLRQTSSERTSPAQYFPWQTLPGRISPGPISLG